VKKAIIMGAAGRDFHNFNNYFKDNRDYEVVAFTATQIPGIDNRIYPLVLAGENYPMGIPIYPEDKLEELIKENNIDEVIFAYSDISHEELMHKASLVIASGADFKLMGTKNTMIKSRLPVIAITATRTGSGKSQVSRYIGNILVSLGIKPIIIRHPMPYGQLSEQRVQRFAKLDDLDLHKCTIEEREEYEPHIEAGLVVYAGVDYGEILKQAEAEGDVIIWDGGNNDFSFYVPDLNIVVVDPLRIGDETSYYPGEINLLSGDVVIINKVNTAKLESIEKLEKIIYENNPRAKVILANSNISVDNKELIKDKRVLVVEDGPTLTHGQMSYGAGVIAARMFGAAELIAPHQFAVGSIALTLKKWPELKELIPAMGYSREQIRDLEETINNSTADLVITGTPIDLSRVINIGKPVVRVKYDIEEIEPQLEKLITMMLGI
jgi:predicted GTPase